jgi:hypothetical protein
MPRDFARRIHRSVARPFAAWGVLVLSRVASRVLAVGTGARTLLELTALTASVNAYWLLAGPAIGAIRRRVAGLPVHVRWLSLVATAAVALGAEALWYRLVLLGYHGHPLRWTEAVVDRADVNILIVGLIVGAGWLAEEFERATNRQRQRDELESLLVEADLRALMLQLQPHFLFNTLQLAAEAAFDDLATAKHIAAELQRLLERSFEFENQRLVPVSIEVDFLHSFIAIERRRFGTRLTVEVHVDPQARKLLIPPLLLQPLVENSIQHGLGSVARDGHVVVRISKASELLRVTVRDNGVGFAQPTAARPGGLGLDVTRRRLLALFPDQNTMHIGNGPDGGAMVIVAIPARHPSSSVDRASAEIPRGDSPREWGLPTGAWLAVIGVALVILDLGVALALLDRTSANPTPMHRASVLMWAPVELLAPALAVVAWQARSVKRWLHERDGETRRLRREVNAARERAQGLRAGKDLMLAGVARLAHARTAHEFDDIILRTSEMLRRLLNSDPHESRSGWDGPAVHSHARNPHR